VPKNYYVYILTNKPCGTLYIGVTSDLEKRFAQHLNKLPGSFTEKYGIKTLVYYEIHNDIRLAIQREKQIKRWKREWKLQLIERDNPEWENLGRVL
jgi:putative endonuclease